MPAGHFDSLQLGPLAIPPLAHYTPGGERGHRPRAQARTRAHGRRHRPRAQGDG